jgi:hypothetical protein
MVGVDLGRISKTEEGLNLKAARPLMGTSGFSFGQWRGSFRVEFSLERRQKMKVRKFRIAIADPAARERIKRAVLLLLNKRLGASRAQRAKLNPFRR